MGRMKGTPKTGGRQKGTPNKATAAVKSYITDVLQRYMRPAEAGSTAPTLEMDLQQMAPEDRVKAMTNLAAYILPKQQALTIDEQQQAEEAALTQWLQDAPDDAIDGIAARLLQIQSSTATDKIEN